MNLRKPLRAISLLALGFAFALSGCQSKEERARGAFDQYQAATASGDLIAARRALLKLVARDDSVAQYWIELGKTNLALADFGGAYSAFIRAHELDRANPEVLGLLTQLALRSGNLARAEEHARELELVAPEDPAVRLTYGYVALRRNDLAAANDQVVKLLAAAPYEPSAKVLRARIMLQSGKAADAIASLREQIRLQPSDVQALSALLDIYERRDQWDEAAGIARSMIRLQPDQKDLRVRLVEDELRAGRSQDAMATTVSALNDANPQQIERLLAPWTANGNQDVMIGSVAAMADRVTGDRQLALARFLAFSTQPSRAVALTRDQATQPVRPANVTANALYGAALVRASGDPAGIARLNAVLALDPNNADALRARAEMMSKAARHKQAIEDATRLVSATRASVAARLLLTRIYAAAGRPEDAKRTLWDAFHSIPANRSIYQTLRSVVQATQGASDAGRLDEEYDDQREVVMSRSFG
jgi:predicted Zn-dependent protease